MSMTPKQAAVLQYIIDRLEQDSICPSYQEISDALGLHGKGNIARMVEQLERRGYLQRGGRGHARDLRVTRMPGEGIIIASRIEQAAIDLVAGALVLDKGRRTVDLRVKRDLWDKLEAAL